MLIRTKLLFAFLGIALGFGIEILLIQMTSKDIHQNLGFAKEIQDFSDYLLDLDMLINQLTRNNAMRVRQQFKTSHSHALSELALLRQKKQVDPFILRDIDENLKTLQKQFGELLMILKTEKLSSIHLKRTRILSDQFHIEVRHIFQRLGTLSSHVRSNIQIAQIRMKRMILVVGSIMVLLVMFIGFGIHQMLTHRFEAFQIAAAKIGEGNLDHRIEDSSRDEIGSLGQAFNKMVEDLEKTLVQKHQLEISEKKLEEALTNAERSNQELEKFAYVASHDLQEPLRMVASFTQLLADRYGGQLDERADKYINFAVDGATRMKGLINDLLSYSRLNTHGNPHQELNLQELVQGILFSITHQIEESNAQITIIKPLPTIFGEKSQIIQLFQNLITNAVKFRSQKKPVITVDWTEDSRFFHFTIEDNGIGIEPQYFELIFIIFQRLNERDKFEGSGMGLAIVKKIVERHGGHIRVSSKPGEGSRFMFTLKKHKKKEDKEHESNQSIAS